MSSSRNGIRENSIKTEVNCSSLYMNQFHGWSCVQNICCPGEWNRFTGNRSSWLLKSSRKWWPVRRCGCAFAMQTLEVLAQCLPCALDIATMLPTWMIWRKSSSKASTLLPLTTSLALALPLGVIAMATGILVRSLFYKIWRMRKLVGMNVEVVSCMDPLV